MVHFFIPTKREEGTAPVYLRIRSRKPFIDMWIVTKVIVDIKKWHKCKGDAEKYSRLGDDEKTAARILHYINSAVIERVQSGDFSRDEMQKLVDSVTLQVRMAKPKDNSDDLVVSINELRNEVAALKEYMVQFAELCSNILAAKESVL